MMKWRWWNGSDGDEGGDDDIDIGDDIIDINMNDNVDNKHYDDVALLYSEVGYSDVDDVCDEIWCCKCVV